jgi:LytR cell envelope-related transcriptional attenuator
MNEGAGRGFILIAVAVLIGAVLLGKGLDDSVSTASNDDGSSPSNTTAAPDDTGDDSVASPVAPAEINVVVANGSGVSGAAGAVAETLAGLGYVNPLAIDTIAGSDTPLDTVYYATQPDSSAQAEQVASDLGLPPGSVQPYPAEGAPADIGLAQVLVVLGSAPGMLSTSDTATSTPTTVA